MPFLRSHYTVFDRTAKQLHIADQGQGCEPVKDRGRDAREGFQGRAAMTAIHETTERLQSRPGPYHAPPRRSSWSSAS